jgi:hypothetical protein
MKVRDILVGGMEVKTTCAEQIELLPSPSVQIALTDLPSTRRALRPSNDQPRPPRSLLSFREDPGCSAAPCEAI